MATLNDQLEARAAGMRQGLPLLPLTEMTHRPLGSAPRAPAAGTSHTEETRP
jgi:hypothetical protein